MLLDRLVIKGNEIKEPGLFGKTVYVIKGNEIKEPGWLGKTVYIIDGDKIKEPGFFGQTVYVIKGEEIRTPGWFGTTVAKTKADGTIKYNKPTEPILVADDDPKDKKKGTAIESTPQVAPAYVEDPETLADLQKRLEVEQGCVLDFTNCSAGRKSYTIPTKYNKLQAIAPALNLEVVRIHSGVALIVAKNARVKKAFEVDAENPYYIAEDGVLYNKTKTVLVRVPIEYDIASIKIPNTVTVIGEGAFSGCIMGQFTVPPTVTKIGKSAFAYCKKFKSIYLPKTVTIVGEKAFEYDNTVQITTDAESKPNGWKFEESEISKPIKWGTK